jgi:hypothetical protein
MHSKGILALSGILRTLSGCSQWHQGKDSQYSYLSFDPSEKMADQAKLRYFIIAPYHQ